MPHSEPPRGRYVRIELPGHEQILHLAEVQVFSGPENIALKGKAKQSTTDFGGNAHFAIDGITEGDYVKHTTSHTSKSTDPWWEVDLGKSHELNHIVIWNRTDSGLQSRLKDFRVIVLDQKHNPVWETEIATPPDPTLDLDLTASRTIVLKDAGESVQKKKPQKSTASEEAPDHQGDADIAGRCALIGRSSRPL